MKNVFATAFRKVNGESHPSSLFGLPNERIK